MIRRRNLPALFAVLAAGTARAADLNQKDPARLEAAAVAIAASGNGADIAELARRLADAAFLRRLDPEANDLTRLTAVFQALTAHPSPATAALCLRVAQSKAFAAIPARWNLLLPALAAVRPMNAEAGQLFVKMGRAGFLEVNIPLLAGNATTEALQGMESLLADETLRVEQRVSATHWGILPNRLKPGVVEACARVVGRLGVSPAVAMAIIETLFDNRPAEWFGKRSPYPTPPPWNQATAATRAAYRTLADTVRRRADVSARLRKVVDEAVLQLGKG
ncbi:MAG: hypothetical protein HYX27_27705 [Acidobacteria bacterium]|nr:hypothetical protein [Acidobacteriota bacterium]